MLMRFGYVQFDYLQINLILPNRFKILNVAFSNEKLTFLTDQEEALNHCDLTPALEPITALTYPVESLHAQTN